MESQLTINTNNMKRTNLLLLSLCALGLIFTRCDFNWNFSRKYTIAIKQPDQAYIQSAELDSIWKSSYEYAVSIPEDTTISTYFHLIEALNSNQPYNCTNTLIICHTKDTASMKELAPGYALYISDFIAKEGMCNKSCYFNIHKDINKYQIEKIKCEF